MDTIDLVEEVRRNVEILNRAYAFRLMVTDNELIYKEVNDEKAAEVADTLARTQEGVERVAEVLGREEV